MYYNMVMRTYVYMHEHILGFFFNLFCFCHESPTLLGGILSYFPLSCLFQHLNVIRRHLGTPTA